MTETEVEKFAREIDARNSFVNGCLSISRKHRVLFARASERSSPAAARRELEAIRQSAVHLEVLLCELSGDAGRAIGSFRTDKLSTELDALSKCCAEALAQVTAKGNPGRGYRLVTVDSLVTLYAEHDLKPRSTDFNRIAAKLMNAAGDKSVTDAQIKTLRNRRA
jgi:hypothetical protein